MISPNEKKLLEIIRELRSYESITISKDKLGKVDSYFVNRVQKIVVDNN